MHGKHYQSGAVERRLEAARTSACFFGWRCAAVPPPSMATTQLARRKHAAPAEPSRGFRGPRVCSPARSQSRPLAGCSGGQSAAQRGGAKKPSEGSDSGPPPPTPRGSQSPAAPPAHIAPCPQACAARLQRISAALAAAPAACRPAAEPCTRLRTAQAVRARPPTSSLGSEQKPPGPPACRPPGAWAHLRPWLWHHIQPNPHSSTAIHTPPILTTPHSFPTPARPGPARPAQLHILRRPARRCPRRASGRTCRSSNTLPPWSISSLATSRYSPRTASSSCSTAERSVQRSAHHHRSRHARLNAQRSGPNGRP